MKLVCPSCGAIASADAWVNDANARETLLLISRLPSPLPSVSLSYLALFRPGKSALSWKKAMRIAGEIEALVAKGYVSRRGQIDRTSPPSIWAKGMEQMVDQRARLNLPMPNHNYLVKVVYDLAMQADISTEPKPQPVRNHHQQRRDADDSRSNLAKAYAEWDAKHGQDSDSQSAFERAVKEVSNIVKGME